MIYERELSDRIIGCAIDVQRSLGPFYMEKLYEKALMVEFEYNGIKAVSQVPIDIYYRGIAVGNYLIDILVEDKIILELKACSKIIPAHEAQLIQYLAAMKKKAGYIINFASTGKLEFVRRSL